MKNPPHYPLAIDKVALRRRRRRRGRRRQLERRGARRARRGRRRLRAAARGRRPRRRAAATGSLVHDDLGTNTVLHLGADIREPDGRRRRVRRGRAHGEASATSSSASSRWRWSRGPCAAVPAAVRRRHHALLGHPDPAHPQDHGRRSPSASPSTSCGSSRRRSAAASARSSTSTPRSCSASRSPASYGVPVRWIEERTENAQATIQGRGQIQDIELAADADGKLTAVRVHLVADMGAYLQLVTPGIPLLGAFLYAGVYDLPAAYSFSVHGRVHDDDAHRRLPRRRPARGDLRHRAGDGRAGRARSGIDPVELRRRNFIPADAVPVHRDDRARVRPRRPPRRARPRRSSWPTTTAAGRAGRRRAARRHQAPRDRHLVVLRDVRPGAVAACSASLNYARRRLGGGDRAGAADQQGPGGHRHHAARPGPRDVVVDDRRRPARRRARRRRGAALRHRDHARSASTPTARGRSPSAASPSTWPCDKVIDKARTIAAHQLEAAEDDLEFVGGTFSVKGSPDTAMPLAAIAFEAFTAHNLPDGIEPNLEAQRHLRPAQLLVAVRHAHLRGRGRRGDRRGRGAASTSPSTTAATRSTR